MVDREGRPKTDDEALIVADLQRVASIGWYAWDLREDSRAWSDGMFRLLGLTPGEGGRRMPQSAAAAFLERVHPDDRERVRGAYGRLVAEGASPDLTYRIVRPDGTVRLVRAYGVVTHDDAGRPARLTGILVDMTELSLATHRLAEADVLLAETQRVAGVGSSIYDFTTGRSEWSRALYDMFGIDPTIDPTPDLPSRMTHPDDRLRQVEWGMRLAAGEEMPPLVVRIIRPDGTMRHIETRGRFVQSDAGPRIVGVTVDITARVELEERLRHAAKLEAVGTLASGVAHDFNNYLAVMQLELNALERGAASHQASAIDSLRVALDRCTNLTRQLLAFARKHPSTPEVVDFAEVVQSAMLLFTRLVGPNVKVELSIADPAVHVIADRGQLDSIVMNLLINARDAMPSGGRIGVVLERIDLRAAVAVEEPGCTPGPHAKLTISDSGTGIAADALPRMFEPYYSTKELGRGTGLGLATVYRAVKDRGGFIRVRSGEGCGSSFEVYLPASDRLPSKPSEGVDALRATLAGTVLVVEDMPPLLEVAARLLRDVGLTVHTAESGEAALEVIRRVGCVDVVLTDMVMPHMGGIELARALADAAPAARLAFMSGYVDRALMERAEREAPDVPVIRKPFDRSELLRVVSQLLEPRRQPA